MAVPQSSQALLHSARSGAGPRAGRGSRHGGAGAAPSWGRGVSSASCGPSVVCDIPPAFYGPSRSVAPQGSVAPQRCVTRQGAGLPRCEAAGPAGGVPQGCWDSGDGARQGDASQKLQNQFDWKRPLRSPWEVFAAFLQQNTLNLTITRTNSCFFVRFLLRGVEVNMGDVSFSPGQLELGLRASLLQDFLSEWPTRKDFSTLGRFCAVLSQQMAAMALVTGTHRRTRGVIYRFTLPDRSFTKKNQSNDNYFGSC